MLSSITAGGGLPVTNIANDIKQLQVQDFRQSSYSDEDRAYLMADRVTSSFDINRGEVGLASASATSTLTRDRNIRDTFVLVQEGIGFFIERLILNQYIPLLKETMKEEDVIKITGDTTYLAFIDELIVGKRKDKFITEHIGKTGFYPEQEKIDEFSQKQNKYLASMGKSRFVDYFNNIFDENVDVEVHITDEKFNRIVAVQQLRDSLVAYSRLPVASKLDTDAIFKEMFNIMGLKGEFFLEQAQLPITALQGGNNTPVDLNREFGQGVTNENTAFSNASKLPQIGQGGGQPIQQGADQGFRTQVNVAAPLSNIG